MSKSFYYKTITNAQWNRMKIVFETPGKVGRPPLNPRTVLNAILWILSNGARWRDLPSHYGNWNSIYHKFRQWCESALFARLLRLLNSQATDTSLLELDSTFCKVHQSARSSLKGQQSVRQEAARTPKFTCSSTKKCTFWTWYWPADKFTTAKKPLTFSRVKKFLPTKLSPPNRFVIILSDGARLFAFPTKSIPSVRGKMILT